MNENINSMMAASARISSLKSEINTLEESMLFTRQEKSTASAKKYDAKISIDSFERSHGQANLSTQAQNELDALKLRHKETAEAFEQADSQHQDLSSKLDSLNHELNELAGCEYSITINNVMDIQSDIQKAQNVVDEIQTLISRHNETIQTGVGAKQTLNGLYQKRDDLRAELALGANAPETDLKTLDKEIDVEKQKSEETHKSVKEAKYTVQGLQRKLAPAVAKLNELKSTLRPVTIQLLQGKIERLVAEYSLQAQPLINTFKQIHVLNQIMINEFKHPPVTGPLHMQMCIPAFHLKEITGVVGQQSAAVFSFRQGMDAGEFVGVEVDGVEEMRKQGLLN